MGVVTVFSRLSSLSYMLCSLWLWLLHVSVHAVLWRRWVRRMTTLPVIQDQETCRIHRMLIIHISLLLEMVIPMMIIIIQILILGIVFLFPFCNSSILCLFVLNTLFDCECVWMMIWGSFEEFWSSELSWLLTIGRIEICHNIDNSMI